MLPLLSHYMSTEDLNSGPCAYIASTLPTEPSAQTPKESAGVSSSRLVEVGREKAAE